MKIDHFAFEVSNLEASIQFYVDKLGFKLLGAYKDEKEHEKFALLEMDAAKIELLQPLDEHNQPVPFAPIEARSHHCPHLAIQTDDFDRTLQQLAAWGLEIAHGPLEIPGVARWLYFHDPDGNVIEYCTEINTGNTENTEKN